jgi:hypothetical protein
MRTYIKNYLQEIQEHLHLSPETENKVLQEMYVHLKEKTAELRRQGRQESDAEKEAVRAFGKARSVARLTYEAFSQGSTIDGLISFVPHLVVSLVFATHIWHLPVVHGIVFSLLLITTLYGWRRGEPNWLFSWVGYPLFPLFLIGYLSRSVWAETIQHCMGMEVALPPWWHILTVTIFYVFGLYIIISTTIKVLKRDWIFASLMLVPLPLLGTWVVNIDQTGVLYNNYFPMAHQWDMAMSWVFLFLGVTAFLFVRLRQRILKGGSVITIGMISGAILVHRFWGKGGFVGILVVSLVLLLCLVTPALLGQRLKHDKKKIAFQNFD